MSTTNSILPANPVAQPAATPSAGWKRRKFLSVMAATGAVATFPQIWLKAATAEQASGTVFHDTDGDGRKGRNDPGLAGVAVSNGREVVVTDEKGRWRLPLRDARATDFFVVKPKGWAIPNSPDLLPLHYYIHQPNGSPAQRHAGNPPTGPLPESIDFPLLAADESEKFRMLVCGDPQPRDQREIDYLTNSIPALRAAGGLLGLSLGDVAFDDLRVYPAVNRVLAATGLPWRHALGNHDLNQDAPDDTYARESFRRVYGPTYYSFNFGKVHFVVLDNVRWAGPNPEMGRDRGQYHGELGETQRQWLQADLALVPNNHLVVCFMHIPLRAESGEPYWGSTSDRNELFQLLKNHPHNISFAAHRHYHRHDFIQESGWPHPEPHHHLVVGTLCGSWFRGSPDSFGIPHGTMCDGTPRGFIAADFNGHICDIPGYQTIGSPQGQQMHIHVPDQADGAQITRNLTFHVNYYNGSERSALRARCGTRDQWQKLARVVEPDPHYVALVKKEGELAPPWRTLRSNPDHCDHLWRGELPDNLEAGEYVLEVIAEDGFGHTHHQSRFIRIAS